MAKMHPRLAPENLAQSILPWTWFQGATFNLFSPVIGATRKPELEEEILDHVGSYGRQLGKIGDALAVLIALAPKTDLTEEQREALVLCEAQLLEIEKLKKGWRA